MKVYEAVKQADDLRSNDLKTSEKVRWLSKLDGKIMTNVMLMDVAETEQTKYDESCMEREMMIPHPYDDIYPQFLCAMIDYANGEFNLYQNDLAVYNATYTEMVRWFARTYKPADRKQGGKYYDA